MRTQDSRQQTFHGADSKWLRSFSLADVKCLVVCRGPVRREAFDVFDAIGIREYGMLLSEKDSVVYPRCMAPEMRSLRFPRNIHRVPDYMGAGQEEKLERIREIVGIAESHGYTHIFAGYGFMAEDADFVQAIEDSSVDFIGPSAGVIRAAGAKDEAKKLARGLGNSVIPGIDDVSARALVAKAGDRAGLEKLAAASGCSFRWDDARSIEDNAERLLQLGYAKTVELVTIDELKAAAAVEARAIWKEHPGRRIRFKAIGGGGGKGQRVIEKPKEVAAAVMDILAEQKVVAPGSNRNFLIELNLETTRHNEIQVIGNGAWCVSLGGRDCSIQMHEQKQLEFSLNEEVLEEAIATAKGLTKKTLQGDLQCLRAMEADGERFGAGVGLDSVSTFECIVDGFDHFFMEMNTRIQVEHGITELVYALKFTNPDDPDEHFIVERLIEAMALLRLHGPHLPKPTRVPRYVSGAEIRVNATNWALQPHAGGLIRSWSPPLPFEIRDDQGIGTRNPDTGTFAYYNLAGAYDSNIALILTHGASRKHNLEALAEIMRQMEIRGDDVETSSPVHYGLINWILGTCPMLKPSTRFLAPYLAAVGSLHTVARDVDLEIAAAELIGGMPGAEARRVFQSKETLLLRPLGHLLADPHSLAGFFGLHDGRLWRIENGSASFAANPISFLWELYHYLHMDFAPGKPASEMIWEHDHEHLEAARAFYGEIVERSGNAAWPELEKLFEGSGNEAVAGGDAGLWKACVASHRGFQLGLELLLIIPRIAVEAGFADITVSEALEPIFPDQFLDPKVASELTRALAPPPKASSDEIVAPSGGTFYSREAPHLPQLIEVGDHFEAGQPLFIIEVMKMFNKVYAPFAGTVVGNLMSGHDGEIVRAGQPVFKIQPDEVLVHESDASIRERRQAVTKALLR
jgi:acetyl/propionyl-CoA carboxylase alpha subunit